MLTDLSTSKIVRDLPPVSAEIDPSVLSGNNVTEKTIQTMVRTFEFSDLIGNSKSFARHLE